MICFGDTSYFLAILNHGDDHHEDALKWSRRPDLKIMTTEFVVLELGNALAALPGRRMFEVLVNGVRASSDFTVVPLSQSLMQKGETLFAQRPDKEWSLIDCISFVVMKEQKLNDALTSDHHFAQAGFKVLLK